MSRRVIVPLSIALLIALGVFAVTISNSTDAQTTDAQITSHEHSRHGRRCDFRSEMRRLWEDHIGWTRNFVISELDDLADKEAVTQRLLRNQVDIGNAFKPFYGNRVGDRLTALLTEHIIIAAELVAAAEANDTPRVEDATRRWRVNADQIAALWNAINPRNWPLDEMKQMMQEHLDTTIAEVVARLTADFEADVRAYDNVHEKILEMADMLSDGIIDQFPRRF